MKNAVLLVVGLVLLVVAVPVLGAAVAPVLASATFSALWSWSVLVHLVAAVVGAVAVVESGVLR